MTRFAEVCVAPAEPLGDGAAEFALEFDKLLPVIHATFNSSSHTHSCALSTYQLFRLELTLILVGSCHAVLHSSKVGTLALEALEVGKLED